MSDLQERMALEVAEWRKKAEVAMAEAEDAQRWVDAAEHASSTLIAALEDLGVSPYNADGEAGDMVDPEDAAEHVKDEVARLVREGREAAEAERDAGRLDE